MTGRVSTLMREKDLGQILEVERRVMLVKIVEDFANRADTETHQRKYYDWKI